MRFGMMVMALLFCCSFFSSVRAEAVAGDGVAALQLEVQDLQDELQRVQKDADDLKARVERMEERLGGSFGYTSPMDTIERRLSDVEDDVKVLKRR